MKKVLKQIWAGWKQFARLVGRVNTVILLTLFYFLILSPLGGIMRLFGWSPLESESRFRRRGSNWRSVQHPADRESLGRQS